MVHVGSGRIIAGGADLSRTSALVTGAAGGAIATVAMSAVMVAGDRMGLMGEQPPTAITRTALRDAGVDRPAEPANVVAPFAHLAFGAMAGLIYGLLRGVVRRGTGGLLGMIFGLGVWVVSYNGWIPALGILPPPEDDRPGRPAVMLVAHLVYGFVLGRLVGRP
jgi:hypothetical protein